MRRMLGVALVSALAVDSGGQDLKYAWWLTTEFIPEAVDIESIPLPELDQSWVAASLLRDAPLPAEASLAGEGLVDHGASFEVVTDLDGDGRPEKTVVGVYLNRTGELGKFVLVLTQTTGGSWKKRALFSVGGGAGFSALFRQGNRLRWASCMECDSSCDILPQPRDWTLECHSCCE